MLQEWVDPAVVRAWEARDRVLRANGFPDVLPESFKTDDWLNAYKEFEEPGINPLVFTGLEPREWFEYRQAAHKPVSRKGRGKAVRKKSRWCAGGLFFCLWAATVQTNSATSPDVWNFDRTLVSLA